MMNKKMIVSFLTGILISAVALYFAFRNVPFSDLVEYLKAFNYWWIIPSVTLVYISFMCRGLRWQVILGTSHPIPFWRTYHPMMIGFMLNCILPARVGELARPAILLQKDNVPFPTGLATVAAERVFDLFILIIMLTVVLSTVQIDPNIEIPFGEYRLNKAMLETISGGMIKMGLVLILGIIGVSIDRFRQLITKVLLGVPNLAAFAGEPAKKLLIRYVSLPLIGIMENIAAGFSLVKDVKRMSLCLGISTVVWVLNAISYHLMALGAPGMQLSFFEITTVMIIICFFIALPSVPGFWGLWEAGGVFALTLFAVPTKEAAGFALASHAVQMFPVIIIGLVSAVVYSVNLRQVAKQKGGA